MYALIPQFSLCVIRRLYLLNLLDPCFPVLPYISPQSPCHCWGQSRVDWRLIPSFERVHEKTLHDFDFKPGALVLIRNSSIKTDLGRKSKLHYLGPMVVVRRTPNGSYRLAELNGAVSKLQFAAFRLVPYHARS
ncbi:hypothetical protein BJY52DRAFT_1199343 [Lactarius psammicola]|nr:hypothetical protein BJY52DRAFT_1199343 [Lactarius psammicola]